MYELDLNPYNLVIIASVFIGLIFGLLLIFTKRINQRANRYLGGLALIIVFWNVWVLSLDLDVFRYFPKFYLIPVNFSLALGPLLYLYVKKMTTPEWSFSKNNWLHFLPLLFELLVHVILCQESLKKGILATDTNAFYSLIPIVQLFAIISILTYCYKALSLIRKYHVWLKANYSNDNKYNLRWLYRLTIIFAVLWFMLVPYTLIDYTVFNFKLGIRDYYPIYILLSLITLWISIEAFLKPEIVFMDNIKEDKSNKLEQKPEPTQEILHKADWLKQEMERNLFYLDSELSLKSLALDLDIHPNTLSKIINDGLGNNFSDFINDYRVNAVISRLKDSKYHRITLLGISFECGFNSKSTFNRVFKNITGKTPVDFKKSATKL
jgi:AraC-like DNA-binding protein